MDRPTTAIDVPQHVLEYLQQHQTLTLATSSPAGVPHAATLVYVTDGLAIGVWTQPDSVTARNIEHLRRIDVSRYPKALSNGLRLQTELRAS